MRIRLALLGALALVVGLSVEARAEQASVLDTSGTVYSVVTGTYRQLFPATATAVNGDNPVMALDITRPGQLPARQLIPDTDGWEIESSPYLLLDGSGTLFVLWQARQNVNSMLFLRSLQGSKWGPPILILGNSFSIKSAPQIAMTRDTLTVDGGAVTRTILHLIWWEDADGGRVLYAPLVLVNGEYQGADQPVLVLNDLDTASGVPDARVSNALYESPRLQLGRADRSVVIGFANSRNGHLATVEATVLPSDLDFLADDVRAHIITGGLQWPSNPTFIGDQVRAHIITGGKGGRLSSRVLSFLGDQVRAHIITGGLTANQVAAEDVRGFILASGAELLQNGLAGDGGLQQALIQPPADASAGLEPEAPAATVLVHLATSRPAPLTGSQANSLVLSEDASRVAAAWEQNTTSITFCESTDTGWTNAVSLTLAGNLTRDAAYRLISDRVRGH